MDPAAEQVLNAAMGLRDEDKLELAEALLDSLQPTDRPPFDESWRDVIAKRSEEVQSGKVVPIPWSEVKRQAEEALGE
jgi:putative addiction module component (TIGR02574 family)